MRLDTSDFLQRVIFLTGNWDEQIAVILRARLKPRDIFVDVGANVGYFSLLAATRCARVISFEPNPACASVLEENISLNLVKNVDVRRVALSDHCGSADLYFGIPGNLGAASFKTDRGDKVLVPLETLERAMSGITPSLIKIDVEGSELAVLRGAISILQRTDAPDVICEISEYSLRCLGTSKDELFEFMGACGYRCDVISPVRRSISKTTSIFFQYDVLFSKNEA